MKRGKNTSGHNKRGHNKTVIKSGVSFWEQEYADHDTLAMSTTPSGDLQKFTRWIKREFKNNFPFNLGQRVTDIGCGNGRNLNFIAEQYGLRGIGFDISEQAVSLARKNKGNANVEYSVHSLAKFPYPVESETQTLVLDMMASHILNTEERKAMRAEVYRIMKPDGWLFYKTFVLDGDLNAKRMIKQYPGPEPNSYVHPQIGHVEYMLDEEDIIAELEAAGFYVHKVYKSHKHLVNGRAAKRRSVSIYAQK